MENEVYQEIWGDSVPYVQVRGLRDGDNKDVQVINSDGATEVYIAKGADLIVDNTQTGSSLRKAGLKELETIIHSSAGLYAGVSCTGEKMAGFRSLETGRFREIMLIQSDRDYREFLRRYAVDPRNVDQDVLES